MPSTVGSSARLDEATADSVQTNGVKTTNGVNGHSNPIDLAEYLFRRLHELGIRSVHGLPGDYNLVALDYLPKVGLDWVGNANELNAGYAADGYARVKGVSAMITTFGVGELSSINAIAGAYSEYVPVIHIVGSPSTASQKEGVLLHHTLGDGNYQVFAEMSRHVSCAVAILDDPSNAAAMVDNALRTCILKSRPIYISLPSNMVQAKVDGDRLKYPIDLSVPPNDHKRESHVVDMITTLLKTAKRPALLVDLLAIRHHATDEINQFITKSNIPAFVTPMGKGAVDETLPQFQGIYVGEASASIIRDNFHASDLILNIGPLKSDINTGCFTSKADQVTNVEFHADKTIVGFSEFPGIRMKGLLHHLVKSLDMLDLPAQIPLNQAKRKRVDEDADHQELTHDWLWPKVTEFLKTNDIVITEAGTSNFGVWDTGFKKGTIGISSVLWSSIGFSLGACQGAALAAREMADASRRTVLFIGDGSFQLTCQELSTIIRHKLTPTIFIICNNGYVIERYVHGMNAPYNDIQPWKFNDIAAVFGAQPDTCKTYQIRTRKELQDLFNDREFCYGNVLQLVELYLPGEDAPKSMKMLAAAAARRNAKK
ncbi:pyruvate decarboxylase [Blastomyces dermatitidis ER-3]|uniref:Pyruvate decarboxylase n=1 Tax=Ajellomyces dermatitidis (strain ER-3 / ATCC MYA-2586) TaxID=559297 RepID=A0ABM9YHU5_AJEDR|nr:pyruvate decarboxylase [Blastomyces dermatitidis ER-3]EEQ90019.1 pyruvate decarboxylase [Blastomyces dermatitidis ER-3]